MSGRRVVLFAVAFVMCLLLLAGPAWGWANGELQFGYGTHDWVLDQAYRLAGKPAWFSVSTARSATDDPDYWPYQDWAYHNYNLNGTNPGGGAPTRVAGLFANAVTELKKPTYSVSTLSKTMGMLAHYFADVNNPMHTDESAAETNLVHTRYELRVDTYCRSASQNAGWATLDADGLPTSPVDPTSLTLSAAQASNPGYSSLVANPVVDARTQAALNRAANGLADLIVSVAKAAGR